MTTPCDDIGLSERLQRQGSGEDGYRTVFNGTLLEAAAHLDALSARVKELEGENGGLVMTGTLYKNATSRAEQERDTLSRVIEDIANELGCASDNEVILEAIARLKQERDEALERAAKEVKRLTYKWGNSTGSAYEQGAQDHGNRIYGAIRRLAGPEKGERE